jgi:hypothetical protein
MISAQLLRYYPHFSNLSEDQLEQVANISDKKQFKVEDELFVEGGSCNPLLSHHDRRG